MDGVGREEQMKQDKDNQFILRRCVEWLKNPVFAFLLQQQGRMSHWPAVAM